MQKLAGMEDLRVRRTRKLLQQALIEGSLKKGFAALTVRDITEYAMVNRSTFYRHYFDKYDLLEHHIQELYEALGEDGEIDIDFSGFVPGGPDQITLEKSQPLAESSDEENTPKVKKRNKDAGTTCKERFNYASFDCAANLLKFNKGAKNPNAVLLENKDSYMLNQCALQDKHIILELCEYILIDTVVLANFEFFSSTFREFRVSVSDKWPVKPDRWKVLGTYEAHNTRQIQAFLVENPLIWARYVRIEFLTHYGNEYYCPLSLPRVHGITMMEEWNPETTDLSLESGQANESCEQTNGCSGTIDGAKKSRPDFRVGSCWSLYNHRKHAIVDSTATLESDIDPRAPWFITIRF